MGEKKYNHLFSVTLTFPVETDARNPRDITVDEFVEYFQRRVESTPDMRDVIGIHGVLYEHDSYENETGDEFDALPESETPVLVVPK